MTPSVPAGRRSVLAAACGLLCAAITLPAGAQTLPAPPPEDFPRLDYVYTAEVTIGPTEQVGETFAGVQRIIPITGGVFQGPGIRGTVVPGAADWNLKRNDGATSVQAAYFLRTDDGVVIKIVNQGVNPPPGDGPGPRRPNFTSPTFEAPKGKYDWLNRGTYVGTLTSGRPGTVLIRIFRLV